MSLLCTRGRLEPGDPHITSPAPLQKPLARPPGRRAPPSARPTLGSSAARTLPGLGWGPATPPLASSVRDSHAQPHPSETASLYRPREARRTEEGGRPQAGRGPEARSPGGRPRPLSAQPRPQTALPAPAHLELPHQPQELQQVPGPAARHGRSGWGRSHAAADPNRS